MCRIVFCVPFRRSKIELKLDETKTETDDTIMTVILLPTLLLCLSGIFPITHGERHESCAKWMQHNVFGSLTNGSYEIHNNETNDSIKVYCIFDYKRNFSYTLIESASRYNMKNFLNEPFFDNVSHNMHNVDHYRHSLYRLSLPWMNFLVSTSNYLFSTCNFQTNFTRDWVLISLNGMKNPFQKTLSDSCVEVESINVRGNDCSKNTVEMLQTTCHLYVATGNNTENKDCTCYRSLVVGSAYREQNFGYYNHWNTNFSCTANDDSTTNWWLGDKVDSFAVAEDVPKTNKIDSILAWIDIMTVISGVAVILLAIIGVAISWLISKKRRYRLPQQQESRQALTDIKHEDEDEIRHKDEDEIIKYGVGFGKPIHHFTIATILFACYDLFTDIGYIITLFYQDKLVLEGSLFILSMIVGYILNAILVTWVWGKEFKNSAFKSWFLRYNGKLMSFVKVLSYTDISLLSSVFTSRIFLNKRFEAPFTMASIIKLKMSCIISIVAENLPQLAIQISVLYKMHDYNLISWAKLLVTAIDIIIAIDNVIVWRSLHLARQFSSTQ